VERLVSEPLRRQEEEEKEKVLREAREEIRSMVKQSGPLTQTLGDGFPLPETARGRK